MKVPNPGSQNAINLGCTCPVMDNEYGAGYCFQKNTFVYSADCPLHKEALKRAMINTDCGCEFGCKEDLDYQI